MTQQEFQDLTNTVVNPTTFEQINAIYSATSDGFSKQDFCEDFRLEMLTNRIIGELVEQVANLRTYITHLQVTMEKDREKVANFVIKEAEEYSSTSARRFGVNILGEKEYLRRKISQGYDLWKEDIDFLDKVLR